MSDIFQHPLVQNQPPISMPDAVGALTRLGWDFVGKGRVTNALQVCAKLIETAPELSSTQYLMSVVAFKVGRVEIALEHIETAIGVEKRAVFFLQKAQCQLTANDRDSAKITIEQAVALAKDDVALLVQAGDLLNRCEDINAACKVLRQAEKLEPHNAKVLFNLATSLRYLGDLEEAEQITDGLISRSSDSSQLVLFRADLRRQTPENNHIDELEQGLAQGNRDWKGEMNFCYALAKECEDVGEYSRAFDALTQGSRIRRQHLEYNVDRDIAVLDDIRRHYHSVERCDGSNGYDTSGPIFIVGMPRTGTTLVERILSSHSKVCSVGELNDFSTEMVKEIRRSRSDQPVTKEKIVEASLGCNFNKLGENYVASARQQADSTANYFVDKLPFNFLYCGLIQRALPNAKIIHITRDPMDTCYAIYKTLFGQAYPFSYDLDELATYYIAYRKLMTHWHQVMPGGLLDVAYEEVVANTEQEARRLVEYCGLDWEPECLDFHKTKTASTTASAAQVRQPVYKSSVQKWRHYEEQLAPLKSRFLAHGLISE